MAFEIKREYFELSEVNEYKQKPKKNRSNQSNLLIHNYFCYLTLYSQTLQW